MTRAWMIAAVVLVVLALPGVSLAVDNGGALEGIPIDEGVLWQYKVELKPVTPDTGITTGRVLVYGKPLLPPYNVEVRDSLVFINNVQVLPTPQPPRVLERIQAVRESLRSLPMELLAVRDSVDSVLVRAHGVYDSTYEHVGHDMAVDAAVAYLSTSPYVDSLGVGYGTPLVYLAGYDSPLLMDFTSPEARAYATPTPPETPRTTAEFAAGVARTIVSRLQSNMVMSFFPRNSCETYSTGTLTLFNRTLADASLSLPEKRAILVQHTSHAKWFLANYDREEWLVFGDF